MVDIHGFAHAPLLIVTTEQGQAAEQLVSAMLRAIDINLTACSRINLLPSARFGLPGFSGYLQQQIMGSDTVATLQLVGTPLQLAGLFSTFDPQHLLQHPEDKRTAWEVLKQLRSQLAQ